MEKSIILNLLKILNQFKHKIEKNNRKNSLGRNKNEIGSCIFKVFAFYYNI